VPSAAPAVIAPAVAPSSSPVVALPSARPRVPPPVVASSVAPAAPPKPPRSAPEDLTAQNDLFEVAIARKRAHDTRGAVAALDDLPARYPETLSVKRYVQSA